MRLRRDSKKAPAADVFYVQDQAVAELTNSTAPQAENNYMNDEVYYHHWVQMINVWPYL